MTQRSDFTTDRDNFRALAALVFCHARLSNVPINIRMDQLERVISDSTILADWLWEGLQAIRADQEGEIEIDEVER